MASSVRVGQEVEVSAVKLLGKRKVVDIYGEGNEGLVIDGIVLRHGEGSDQVRGAAKSPGHGYIDAPAGNLARAGQPEALRMHT